MARTDNDTWDLASSVGATAAMVAAARAMASRAPDPLIDDPFAEQLVRAVGLEFFAKLLDGEVSMMESDDPNFNPLRVIDVMAVRTKFFDDFFLAATTAGIRQAVILASGLDSRAYRLPWPLDTVVDEIDQQAVIGFKTGTLSALGANPAPEHRPVAVDLRDDWPAALRANGFDASQPTAWSAEGLLSYLPPDAQDRLFDSITALSAPASRVAAGYVPDIRDRLTQRGKEVSERGRRLGLNLNWSDLIYHGERNDVVAYLADRGWQSTVGTTRELYAHNGFEF